MDRRSIAERAISVIQEPHSIYAFKGDALHQWAKERVKQKLGKEDATFGDAKQANCKDMYFTATNWSRRYTEILSTEVTQNLPLSLAVRASMSFTGAFRDKGQFIPDGKEVYVDGGVVSNYPLRLFDRFKYLNAEEQQRLRDHLAAKPLPVPLSFDSDALVVNTRSIWAFAWTLPPRLLDLPWVNDDQPSIAPV